MLMNPKVQSLTVMATTASQRPWEMAGASPTTSPPPRGQLPSISALTSNLPAAPGSSGLPSPASTRERDSGAWSSQPQSTRSSTYSTSTSNYPLSSNTNSYYMSPNRISAVSNSSNLGPTSHASADFSIPSSAAGPLGSPGFASHQGSMLPSLNQHHDPNRHSQDFPPQESRRSSIGSQVNQGMGSLQLNGASSPYSGSVNHSATSIAQNLSRERGITGPGGLRNSRSQAQLPQNGPNGDGRPSAGFTRVAPPIGRNPRSDIYNADEPVPGQAYAFPDAPDMEPGNLPPKNSTARQLSIADETKPVLGRRDSGRNSITSSVITSDSRLPPGQHRLDDSRALSAPQLNDVDEMADNMSDYMPGTHHHSLQQNQMSNLDDDAMTPDEGGQPYSRTPALRVSHKMAERKRRSEMKDLFENLRSQIPSNQGSKSSKWEILMKASEYIKQLEGTAHNTHAADKQLRLACHDIDLTRRDNDQLRNENQQLLQELQRLRQGSAQQQPPPPPSSQPPANAAPVFPAHYAAPAPPGSMHDLSRSLPPLTNGVNASSSMQGVQYTHEHR